MSLGNSPSSSRFHRVMMNPMRRTETMHAPTRATQVIRPSRRNFYAGVCRSNCPFNAGDGWFVPYRRVREFSDAYEAVISLYVKDFSSNFLCVVPFVLDTATDIT